MAGGALVGGARWGRAGVTSPRRPRRYQQLLADPGHIESVLRQGAERARSYSAPLMQQVREAVGISAVR